MYLSSDAVSFLVSTSGTVIKFVINSKELMSVSEILKHMGQGKERKRAADWLPTIGHILCKRVCVCTRTLQDKECPYTRS